MTTHDYPEVAPSFLVVYEHDSKEFRAVIDGRVHNAELEEALYERVRTWTGLNGVILGEGYTRPWSTGCAPWPASITMLAPVMSSALEKSTYGFYLEDGQLEY